MPLERLQKIIAKSGVYSRRQAEQLINDGKVFLDGKRITEQGVCVDPFKANIVVCGKRVCTHIDYEYLLFHKPRKCLVTRDDPEGRKTIYDYLPKENSHLKPVGRLDYHSEGLILLTNDGSLAQKLTHPQFHLEKVYEVKVESKLGQRQIERLQKGILIDGRKTLPAKVEVIRENPKSTWLKMVLIEGRNRQIRRMCETVGLKVKTLIRTEFGPFKLKEIPYGKGRYQSKYQIQRKLSL